MHKLKPIAKRICNEILTNNNILQLRKFKVERSGTGTRDVTNYFDSLIPDHCYIYVAVNFISKKKNHYCFFDDVGNGAVIELNILRKDILSQKLKQLRDYCIGVLIHEMCHAIDHLCSYGMANASYSKVENNNKENLKKYVLDKMEVNAYVHEIASIKKTFKKVKTYEEFEDILIDKTGVLFDAKYGLDKKDWQEVRKVYLKRLAREGLLPKAMLTKKRKNIKIY